MTQIDIGELEKALAAFFANLAGTAVDAGAVPSTAAGGCALRVASTTAGRFLEPSTYNCEFLVRRTAIDECLAVCDMVQRCLPRFGGEAGDFRIVSIMSENGVTVAQGSDRGSVCYLATMPVTVVATSKS